MRRTSHGAALDTLGDDFKAVREPAKASTVPDRRKSASCRVSPMLKTSGDAPPEKLSSKMANSLSQSNRLLKTYGPVQLASVRDTDAGRRRGRSKLREQKQDESRPAPAKESPARET
jgi:hypothetical protein